MRETEHLDGTRVKDIIEGLDAIYRKIAESQNEWKSVSPFQCPDDCGSCCVDFEPVVFESEALYLAAWMLHHQRDRAEAILSGSFVSPRVGTQHDTEAGCVFFDPVSPWHCTIYEGRGLVCRFFGYSGDRGKDGRPRWKPCKFLPKGDVAAPGAVVHRQYSEAELLDIFGVVPPVMGDITAQVPSLTPDSFQEPILLREALRLAIAKILMLERFVCMPPEPDAPEPNPEAPMPRAS